MKENLSVILTELRRRFEALYGARLVHLILYGSQARGDAELGSDIDVLVVLDGPVNPFEEIHCTGETVAKLSLEYDEVISCVFVSTEQFNHEQSPLLINVRHEGITDWSSLPIKAKSLAREYPLQETQEAYLAVFEVNRGLSQKKMSCEPIG